MREFPLDLFVRRVTVRYLIVHDGSQAHDAHVHVVFLADETGVLDGFAVGNWAVAAIDEKFVDGQV